MRNKLVDKMSDLQDVLPDYPVLNSYTTALRQRAKELGEPDYQSLWTGQAGSAARTGSAADIFNQLVTELESSIRSFDSQ